jgi:hypothetical protein
MDTASNKVVSASFKMATGEQTNIEMSFSGPEIEGLGYVVEYRTVDPAGLPKMALTKHYGHDRIEAVREFRRLVSNASQYV